MKIEKIALSKISPSPDNPRIIKDDKFNKLVKSIKDFPEMLEIRPIVVDEDMVVLGGNMRYKACKAAGFKDVYIIKAESLTEEQKREFIIKDNASFGDWDWSLLNNNDMWDPTSIEDWGVDYFELPSEIDYSILDDDSDDEDNEDIEKKLKDLTDGVKKAIQIEFQLKDYETATELVKHFREQGAYIGGMIIEFLKSEKEKRK